MASRGGKTAQPKTLNPGQKAGSTSKTNNQAGNLKKRMHGAGGKTGYPQ